MKPVLSVFLLFLATKAFSQQENDSAMIIKLLADDYKTMTNWNLDTHIKNVTPTYLLIENGEIWDNKKESEFYLSHVNKSVDRTDHFDIKYVRVYGDVAYAVYFLESDFKDNDKLKTKTWNESVVFRKINGEWKIELIHSTPVAAKNN